MIICYIQSCDNNKVKVVKIAPTDKAVFNIKGNTLHSVYKMPANRGFEYCALDSDRINTVRMQIKKLELVFINEISYPISRP